MHHAVLNCEWELLHRVEVGKARDATVMRLVAMQHSYGNKDCGVRVVTLNGHKGGWVIAGGECSGGLMVAH